jgi:hypothetical protein
MDPVKPKVLLYYRDLGEKSALVNLWDEFTSRGFEPEYEGNLQRHAEIGVYACGPNSFYDFETGEWRKPNNVLSVFMLHDLYQDNGLGARYFLTDPLHIFDLALFPTSKWIDLLENSAQLADTKPKIGSAVVGYPKSDSYFNSKYTASHNVRTNNLSSPTEKRKIKILVAASWESRHIVHDLEVLRDHPEVEISFKSPDWEEAYESKCFGPWRHVLIAQFNESIYVESLLSKSEWIKYLPRKADIFEVISSHDLVVSNGSNVMFEALACGKPVINISDWKHPIGNFGENISEPHIDFPGIICGTSEQLSDLVFIASAPPFFASVETALSKLVDKRFLGVGATKSVDFILETYLDLIGGQIKPDLCLKLKSETTSELSFLELAQIEVLQNEDQHLNLSQNTSFNGTQEELSSAVAERDSALAERDSALAERDSALAERDSALAERDSALAERDNILNSGIWKTTKPYRWLRNKF